MKTERKELNPDYAGMYLRPDSLILDLETTGRYWRTSEIAAVRTVRRDKTGKIMENAIFTESAEDEYDLLETVSALLAETVTLITYNGLSFDLPFLRHRLKAFGLPDSVTGKAVRDLYREYRRISGRFGSPSGRLSDLFGLLYGPSGADSPDEKTKADKNDAEMTFDILLCDGILDFFGKKHTMSGFRADRDHLYGTFHTDLILPHPLSLHDGPFYLILDSGKASVSARIYGGKLRFYHRDVENYWYLPAEGYAIHRAAASFVASGHKEKAVRENCFHLISCTESFLSDKSRVAGYFESVILYLA